MRTVLSVLTIIILVSIYGATLIAVLHPRVGAKYKACYIDRSSLDCNPDHYAVTPEQGMVFSRADLPNWVQFTFGLSYPEGWGRWTDENLSESSGLVFSRNFSGPVCVDFTARAVSWVVGKTLVVRMGGQTHPMPIPGTGLTRYQVQFTDLSPTDSLDFVLPKGIPRVIDLIPTSGDPRRTGLNLANLRILPGACPK